MRLVGTFGAFRSLFSFFGCFFLCINVSRLMAAMANVAPKAISIVGVSEGADS